MLVPAALVWLAVLSFLSQVDEGTSVTALVIAWLVFASAQATMWATVTTSATSGLRPALYPHGGRRVQPLPTAAPRRAGR